MKFVKMQGIGNDYVYLDAVTEESIERRFEGEAGKGLVRRMSDRHRGIGSDGVILVCSPSQREGAGAWAGPAPDVRMRMFNADGSESEMCGNGVRCVAKFAHDRLGIRSNPMHVQTGGGVLEIHYRVAAGRLVEATVDMGQPILDPERVPMDPREAHRGAGPEWEIATDRGTFRLVPVSMGNPHAVIFSLDTAALELDRLGPVIEKHPAFPNRVNVHIVAVSGRTGARMQTWERGAGLTQACGTGACAVLVAGVLTGRLDREAVLSLPGGDLRTRWDEATNHVFMTGPAEDSFEGVWPDSMP